MEQDGLILQKLPSNELPSNLQSMTAHERKVYVTRMANKRKAIQAKMKQLKQQRTLYLANENSLSKISTLETVLIDTLRQQAKSKGYSL